MADEQRTEMILPTVPSGINAELRLYLLQLTELLQKQFTDSATWEGLNTGLGAESDLTGYVDRGDPAAADFELGDLTTDGTWRDLDLSSIVPANAVAVLLFIDIVDDAVGSDLLFRKNGNSNELAVGVIRTQVANVENSSNIICACDAARVIEYQASNLVWTSIDIVVSGWWLNG